MVPNFVEHRFSHLSHKLFPASTDQLMVFLKNVNDVGEAAGVFHASPGSIDAPVQTHKQVIFFQSNLAEQFF
jgi:hypothetical protein